MKECGKVTVLAPEPPQPPQPPQAPSKKPVLPLIFGAAVLYGLLK